MGRGASERARAGSSDAWRPAGPPERDARCKQGCTCALDSPSPLDSHSLTQTPGLRVCVQVCMSAGMCTREEEARDEDGERMVREGGRRQHTSTEFAVKLFPCHLLQVCDHERPQVEDVVAREAVALLDHHDVSCSQQLQFDRRTQATRAAADDQAVHILQDVVASGAACHAAL